MVHKLFDKKTSSVNKGTGINSDVASKNEELANELRKPLVKKIKKQKVLSPFIDNMCDNDLADVQLLSEICFYFALLVFSVNMLGFFL